MSIPVSIAIRSPYKLLDSLVFGVLALVILAGVRLVPFHGDESTIIYMSRDWYTLVCARNPHAVFYRNPPPDPRAATDQQLRLVNGLMGPYSIGLAWSAAGFTVADVNDQWLWGADWNYNRDNGHIPDDDLLFVSRLACTWLTVLSAAVLFVIGRRLGGRGAAWMSTFIYATMPIVLLNGRRAMFEGANLLATTLVMLAGFEVARFLAAASARCVQGQSSERHRSQETGTIKRWLLLGVASGLAVASKHTTILTLIPVFGSLLLIGRHDLFQTICRSAVALAVAGVVFVAASPVWWSAPLEVAGEVLRLRQELTNGQVAAFGGYTNFPDRIGALVQQPFGSPQYYEDRQGWPQWIGGQIATYEAGSPFTVGIAWGWSAVIFLIIGLGMLVRHAWGSGQHAILLNVAWFTALGLLILTPLPWQRYYLPLAPVWAVLFALGALTIWRLARSRYAR